MRNILLVIQKELLLRLKSKVFIIMTLLGPILIFLFGYLIKILDTQNKKEYNIVIYDETKLVERSLKKAEGVNYHFVKKEKLKNIKSDIMKKDWDGLLHIPLPKSGNFSAIETNITFYYNSSPSISIIEKLKKEINDRIRNIKLQKYGIPLQKVYDAETNILINLVSFSNEKDSILLWKVKAMIGGGLGLLIYIFIFIYGAMIMKNILYEKTSRVVEVILSSVKSFHLMMGKIISNALAGIIQFTIWGVGSAIVYFFIKKSIGIVPVNAQLPSQSQGAKYAVNTVNDAFLKNIFDIIEKIDFSVIVSIGLILFILGYLLYSSMFAVIGAIVESDNDAGQFTLPITFPLILAIYMGASILENPNGDVAFWMSMVPFNFPCGFNGKNSFWSSLLANNTIYIYFVRFIYFYSMDWR